MVDVRTLEPFNEELYAENGNFDCEMKSGAFDELTIAFDGAYTGTPANVADDAPFGLLGDIELKQFGTRVRADARTLYVYASILSGSFTNRRAQTALDGNFSGRFTIPFRRILQGMGIDASGVPVAVRGKFRPKDYYGGTAPTTIAAGAALRPVATTVPKIPEGGFRPPEMTEDFLRVESASAKHSLKVDFDEPYLLPHMLLIFRDADGGNGTDASARSDDGIGRVSVLLQGRGPDQLLVNDVPWMTLRAETVRRMGGSTDDETGSVGAVLLPLVENGRPLLLPPGSSLVVKVRNQTDDFSGDQTAITPAAGDSLSVFLPKALLKKEAVKSAGVTSVQTSTRAARSNASGAF